MRLFISPPQSNPHSLADRPRHNRKRNFLFRTTRASLQLLSSYDRTWREIDELKYKIDTVKKSTSDNAHVLDDLEHDLRAKYSDLKRTELDIRDLGKVLI
jgi:hypothetical protein